MNNGIIGTPGGGMSAWARLSYVFENILSISCATSICCIRVSRLWWMSCDGDVMVNGGYVGGKEVSIWEITCLWRKLKNCRDV